MDVNTSGSSSGSGLQEDVVSLKREVTTLHNALQLQSSSLAREQMRAGSLAARLVQKDNTQEARRAHGDRQAATLLRALLVLEASLRKERYTIVQKLQLKDLQIQKQREVIDKLKIQRHCANCQQSIGFTSEQTNIETDPEFHSLDSVENNKLFERSLSYHEKVQHQPFQKNSRLVKSFQMPKNDVKCDPNTSSSEEVCDTGFDSASVQCKNAFVKNKQQFIRKDVMRRSRKFYLRRQSSVDSEISQKRQQTRSAQSSSEDGGVSEKDTKYQHGNNDEDIDDTISKDIQRASNRIDELLKNPEQFNSTENNEDNVQKKPPKQQRRLSISETIDNMHGVKRISRFNEMKYVEENDVNKTSNIKKPDRLIVDVRPWYTNVSDPEQDICCNGTKIKIDRINRSMSVNDILSSSTNDKSHVFKNQLTIPLSASSIELNIEKDAKNINDEDEVFDSNVNNFDCEPNENWYASASDPDDEQSCEIYKNNPVLECVNQILLQNSLDENGSDSPRVYESPSPKSSTKRVQFSTLNSISFDESVGKNGQNNNNNNTNHFLRELQRVSERRSCNKIVKFSLETASEHSYEVPVTSEGFNYEVQSIYSNDYEPIITQPNEIQTRPIPLPRTLNNIKSGESICQKTLSVKNIAQSIESKMNNGGNHYIDMDTKFSSLPCALNKKKVPRAPPALPPKPKNLLSKFKLNNNAVLSTTNSDSVGQIQRINDVPNVLTKNKSNTIKTTNNINNSTIQSEPDYCSISEINVPVISSGKRNLITTRATIEVHNTERFNNNLIEKRSKINNKTNDKEIPMLPQVTEIIIPDEDDVVEPPKIPMDTFPGKNIPHISAKIQMGHSISTILSDIKNRNMDIVSSDFNNKIPKTKDPLKMAEKSRIEMPIFETVENECEKFDLSQNFEEFKIDECEFTAEEYRISSSESGSVDENVEVLDNVDKLNDELNTKNPNDDGPYRIEFTAENDLNAKNNLITCDNNSNTKAVVKNYSKMSNKPDLLSNIDSVETDSVRYSDIESMNSSSSNCGSYNTVKCEPSTFVSKDLTKPDQKSVPFEYFLESSGLCSKSILTPSRPPNSNHKSVTKPKDVKMKSKTAVTAGRATPLYERLGANTAIKYFEPYL